MLVLFTHESLSHNLSTLKNFQVIICEFTLIPIYLGAQNIIIAPRTATSSCTISVWLHLINNDSIDS